MSIAGHVSRRMLEHYSRIRMDAKGRALDCIDRIQKAAIFKGAVNQNVNQLAFEQKSAPAKLLNYMVKVRGFEPLTPACKAWDSFPSTPTIACNH